MMVDPDGEFVIPMLIGAAISVITNGINNVSNNQSFFQGAGKAAFIGGIGGALSFGIGEFAQGLNGFGKFGFQTMAQGTLGGGMSAFDGGSFGSGFLSGSLASVIGAGSSGMMQNSKSALAKGLITTGSGAFSGGLGSYIAGGNFWTGVRNGAISAGLNHAYHSIESAVWRNSIESFDGTEHPGVINLKTASRNKIAAHLLKGIKYHMNSGSDIDLNAMFDCLSAECLGIGATHLLSRTKQHMSNSFFGPSGDLFASVSIGNRNIQMMYEIPLHGPKMGLVFNPFNYQDRILSNGNWAIRWGGTGGLYLNFRNQTSFMRSWILEK
jgi:hypothetical protein